MATQPSQNRSCTKRGVILTCYVDGKKRFRALAVDADRPTAPPTVDSATVPSHRATNVSMAMGMSRYGF